MSSVVIRRLWDRIKRVWLLLKSERVAPREVFWAVFLGVFAGCTPAFGFHGAVALGLATLLRKNRLFCWLGSRISNVLFLPFIAFTEVQLAHRLRAGEWAPFAFEREHVLSQARDLLLDWCLGTIPVGVMLGVLLGSVAWAWARRRERRRRDEVGRTTGADPPAQAA